MSENRNLLTLIITLAIFGIALFTGCGGGSGVTLDVNDGSTQTPVVTDDTTGGSDTTGGTTTSGILPLGTAIPAVPTGADEIALETSARSTSSLLTYPGAEFLSAAGGYLDGDELVLESSATEPAWALYRADGLSGMRITQFMIDTMPGEFDEEYSVGFSNYDDGEWEYYLTTNVPEVMIDLSEETTQLISSLGNCYWLVVVEDGASVRVTMSHLYVDDDPGIPGDPGEYPCPVFGEVDSVGDGYFVVWSLDPVFFSDDGEGDLYRIDYTEYTLWFDQDGNESGPEMLDAGDQVIVDALVDGETITAEFVQELYFAPGGGGDNPGPEYMPLEGEIATIGGGVITLADETSCDYDELTEWLLEEGPGGPEDLEPGDYVMIDCEVTEEGTGLLALMVMEFPEIVDPGDPGDPGSGEFIGPFDGTITAIGEYYIQLVSEIEGENVEVNWDDETLWMTEEGDGTWEDFEAGDFIHIDALETDDGGWLALVVFSWEDPTETGDPGDPGLLPLDFLGEIATIDGDSFTFTDGIEIFYDGETMWFDEEMLPITADDVEPGDFVMVETFIDEAGNPLAVTVFLLG